MPEQLEPAAHGEDRHAVGDGGAQGGSLRDQRISDQGLIPILSAADQDRVGTRWI